MTGQERYANPAYLPLRDIFNTNTSWIRQDPNPDPDLVQSIRQFGMHLPILLRPDYEVIDGARRLHAAVKLGWRDVPVIITSSWPVVQEYFQYTNELDQAQAVVPAGMARKPMQWSEVNDLIRRHLLVRDTANKLGGRLTIPHLDLLVLATGMQASDVRFIRDAFSTIDSCARRDPALGQRALDLARDTEIFSGHKYGMLEHIRGIARGYIDLKQSLNFDPSLKMARGQKKKLGVAQPGSRYGADGRPPIKADMTMARNLVTILEDIALQARTVTDLDDDIKSSEAEDLAKRMTQALVRLRPFKQHLAQRAEDQTN